MRTNFLQTQIRDLLQDAATHQEASWLLDCEVRTRASGQELFTVAMRAPPETVFNHQDPYAMEVFAGAFTNELPHYPLGAFAQGAATVASLLDYNQLGLAMDFIKAQLAVMHQRVHSSQGPYPAIVDGYLPLYSGCLSLILLGAEPSTWRVMVNYVLGIIWMLGHVRGVTPILDPIKETLLGRLRRGTFYD